MRTAFCGNLFNYLVFVNMPFFWFILSTIALLAGLAIIYWIHSQHNLEIKVSDVSRSEQGPAPMISVIVPARNEARNIRRCVGALLQQTYPDYELIVVNDRSTDATARILAEIQAGLTGGDGSANQQAEGLCLRILQGSELPAGWAGKPHVLVQGAEAAQGEWLCFVDADTFAGPDLLSTTLESARAHEADLFTILTDQELGSFWEKVILPLVFSALSVGFPAARVNDPSKPDAIANGQFILIKKAVYDAIGGHRAVYNQIAEDKALADLVKRSGYRLIVADGRAVARTRMYTSFSGIWEGWTKNIFLGMRDRLGLLLFGAVVGLMAALLLPVWLFGGLLWWVEAGGLFPALVVGEALLVWGYLLWMRLQACRAFKISPLYALTLPLGALVFTAMMFTSAFKVVSGRGVTWKGRTYT